jgi:hypothetical protein
MLKFEFVSIFPPKNVATLENGLALFILDPSVSISLLSVVLAGFRVLQTVG